MFDFTGNICYKIYEGKMEFVIKFIFLGGMYDRVFDRVYNWDVYRDNVNKFGNSK